MSDLFYSKKHVSDVISDEEKKLSDEYCEGYKEFLNNAKNEREAVCMAIKLAEEKGFRNYIAGDELKPGDKIYRSVRGKALFLAVIGRAPLSVGVNIAAAHVDSPRLDLKQVPLYEDSGMGLFKTHYYGGIKKFQWVTIPLALLTALCKREPLAATIAGIFS